MTRAQREALERRVLHGAQIELFNPTRRKEKMSMNKNFNIQLFAEDLNTTGTMSVEMKTFYEKRLIDQAEPRLVHDQFADYYPWVPQNGGKTIEFRKYDSLPKASTPLTEGVTPTVRH